MAGLRYLLDSNILSEPTRPLPDPGVRSRLRAHRREICTAAPILHELHYGLARMPEGTRKRELTRYLARKIHRFPAADADPCAVTGRTPSRHFDVVSATPSASLGPCGQSQHRLDALATKIGEFSGLDQVLHPGLVILPYDRDSALWHAGERARLASRGRTPPWVDGQIAAIAKVHDLILITRNTDDFTDFADLEMENWFA